MKKQLSLVAFIYAKPGRESELKSRLMALVDLSRAETGCINYDVHQSLEDPTIFVMYENWQGRSDLDAHFNMPYMEELLSALPELLRAPLQMHYLNMLSNRSGTSDEYAIRRMS